MKLTKKISTLSKKAQAAGKKGYKQAEKFLQSKEGKALVKAVTIALPIILNALPQTRKLRTARKLFSKIR